MDQPRELKWQRLRDSDLRSHIVLGWAGIHHMRVMLAQGAALEQRSVCGVGKALAMRQRVVVKAHELPCRHAEALLHLYTHTYLPCHLSMLWQLKQFEHSC